MSAARSGGFTVVEVVLFLAISGLMMIGILAGTGVAINAQRYRDSVNSLVSYVQGVYDRTANTQNDRRDIFSCDVTALTITTTGPGGGTTAGASDCLILGRLLEVSDGGKKITSRPVYAGSLVTTALSDTEAIKNSKPFTNDTAEAPDAYSPEWDTRLTAVGTDTALDGLRILIVRSPTSGGIRTYVTTASGALSTVVDDINRKDFTVCVHSQGLASFARQGVTIAKDASGTAGLKLTADGVC